jgi:uracil-DNA glycosylase family 4
MHGANRTGRPFTGDHAGILLYATLHQHGFATRPESVSADDALRLRDCRITNAVKCLPPANKPAPDEARRCNDFLRVELTSLRAGGVVIALGAIAHGAVLRATGLAPRAAAFAHGAEHVLPGGRTLLDSYHCSRYNTQTRRLTADMFEAVFARARSLLDAR